MKIVTAKEMNEIDKETINTYGLLGIILMERAGIAVCNFIINHFGLKNKIVVLSGRGNNGGDGFVVARELHNRGLDVCIYFAGNVNDLSQDSLFHYQRALSYGVNIKDLKELFEDFKHYDTSRLIIVDALFGTGINRDIEGDIARAINLINQSKTTVVSVDIPSGICSDTGKVKGTAIKASATVTFGLGKIGHFVSNGREHTGELFIEDIGFPKKLLNQQTIKQYHIDKPMIKPLIPKRPIDSNKKDYGHVLLIAGSKGKTGAAMLAAKSALRTGCGLLTLASADSVIYSLQSSVVEEMTFPLIEDNEGRILHKNIDLLLEFAHKKASVIAIGPGLGLSEDIISLVRELIMSSPVPLVIDADGLNAISRSGLLNCGFSSSIPIVLTPHEGEICRLLSIESVQDRIESARELTRLSGGITILKGHSTIITMPDGKLFINTTGNPGMATGGSGDVLTGIIASFIAQGLTAEDAAIVSIYIHGLAGDIAASKKGLHSLIASDIISSISDAFKELCQIA
ncbi:MAG: NAD(P)H-hydrate dehydratase [Thermodesulfovibrionales bacterium]|nr:NAD(P)H-hydrate dehydratase [Thermodesulfovibrionales bacterium]